MPSEIHRAAIVTGTIVSREDLTISGEVNGTIEMPEQQQTLLVKGTVSGEIIAGGLVVIAAGATVTGHIATPRIRIEEGAFLQASIEIAGTESNPKAASGSA